MLCYVSYFMLRYVKLRYIILYYIISASSVLAVRISCLIAVFVLRKPLFISQILPYVGPVAQSV
jgi:hypothetical protein